MCATSSKVTDSRRAAPSASRAIRASSKTTPAGTALDDRAFMRVNQIARVMDMNETLTAVRPKTLCRGASSISVIYIIATGGRLRELRADDRLLGYNPTMG